MIRLDHCHDIDLVRAWKTHGGTDRLQGLPTASAYILLFYAVECGLKHLLLEKNRSPKCPDKGLFHSHDLTAIFRELSPAAAEVKPAPADLHLQLGSGLKKHQPMCDVHAAWRYGIPIDQENERKIIEWLRQVNRFIADKRRQP
ncbi:MAG: hypothetical protein HQM03_20780 [Magnetococcales bacterium]|nr:hypothetical protein [Magnetococcales bacterium]